MGVWIYPPFRQYIQQAQPHYRHPHTTNPALDCPLTAAAQVEYRAAMGLEPDDPMVAGSGGGGGGADKVGGDAPQTSTTSTSTPATPMPTELGSFPKDRVLYDSTIH